MKTPFALRHRRTSSATDALLLERATPADLVAACSRVGTSTALPTIHAVDGGFLILASGPLPGAIRLRRLAQALFVPVDADLIPSLHADETPALTRDSGLVILPHGRVLGFDSQNPVPVEKFVSGILSRNPAWQPLPEPPALASTIYGIHYVPPLSTPEELLGRPGSPEDLPRPPQAGLGGRVAGGAAVTAGSWMKWLGGLLKSKKLQRLGQRWLERGMQMSPRLSESILGRQAAALQELLRQFRSGNIEAALKRALPMGGDPARGAVPHTTDTLPTHNASWSLGDLFGAGRRGPASIWHGGAELQQQLVAEYRRAAEDALRRGDHRRAAFIYGRLLGDYRAAANALSSGGIHRDAAILFRDKVDDPLRAASEFERAGDFDTALSLYLRHHEHKRAGDLYRKLADEDRAIEQYQLAAERLVTTREDYLAAGGLLWQKTERADLAGAYYTLGWQRRSMSPNASANAIPCAVRLARILAFADTSRPLLDLIGEVESHLADDHHGGPTRLFFTVAAELGDLPHLDHLREELRDRAKLALARTVRRQAEQEVRPGSVVQDSFGRADLWSAPLMRDAAFALERRLKQPSQPAPPRAKQAYAVVALQRGKPTAVAYASGGRALIIGFENGSIARFDLRTGAVLYARVPSTVRSLATDTSGQVMVASTWSAGDIWLYTLWHSENRLESHAGHRLWDEESSFLLPTLSGSGPDAETILLREDGSVIMLRCLTLKIVCNLAPSEDLDLIPYWGLCVPRKGREEWLIRGGGGKLIWRSFSSATLAGSTSALDLGWSPKIPKASSLWSPPLSWLDVTQDWIGMAGVSDEGALYLSQFSLTATTPETTHTWRFAESECMAVAAIRPGLVAAVTADHRLLRLRAWPGHLLRCEGDIVTLPAEAMPIACFACPVQHEVVVLLDDGRLLRVPFSV